VKTAAMRGNQVRREEQPEDEVPPVNVRGRSFVPSVQVEAAETGKAMG